jgi:hypothetical protein
LLLNALEAMSPKGKLTVATENLSNAPGGQHYLRVVIQDTGTGILPEHLNHVFEPFFTTKDYGTGLGLATTRRIVQEHGGTISVESRPGEGTTFAILLPLLVENRGRQLGGFGTSILGKKPGCAVPARVQWAERMRKDVRITPSLAALNAYGPIDVEG